MRRSSWERGAEGTACRRYKEKKTTKWVFFFWFRKHLYMFKVHGLAQDKKILHVNCCVCYGFKLYTKFFVMYDSSPSTFYVDMFSKIKIDLCSREQKNSRNPNNSKIPQVNLWNNKKPLLFQYFRGILRKNTFSSG